MSTQHHKPIWDRGEPVDRAMLAFTIGDDWLMDRELVTHDLRASLAHADALLGAQLLDGPAHARIVAGLQELAREHAAGAWTVDPEDEDVHSAVDRRLTEKIGDDGKRLHAGRSRNEQVATAMRLWLRESAATTKDALTQLIAAMDGLAQERGELPLPGYTHLRRAMPSTLADWAGAHAAALSANAAELDSAAKRWSRCPLGSGSGYGVPVALDRAALARALGFDSPEDPVTAVQHARGRAELAYLTVLEGIALDLGKLAADLWLYTAKEFGFVSLPGAFTTGSSLMPQKRNPDLLELARAQCRQLVADRAALLAVIADLPSGYHRDFQLIKPPLFRAHARISALMPLLAQLLPAMEWNEAALREAAEDPALQATARALAAAAQGVPFREAYRTVAGEASSTEPR
ncbi:MAG: argininosuccinate lyase [Planctomycetota bacterium]|nr:argininosuccinate lyase [Planctomycetota bacterium]